MTLFTLISVPPFRCVEPTRTLNSLATLPLEWKLVDKQKQQQQNEKTAGLQGAMGRCQYPFLSNY